MTRICSCGRTFYIYGPGSSRRLCETCRLQAKITAGYVSKQAQIGGPYEPTEAEITESVAAIQATWSDEERAKRAGALRPQRVEMAEIDSWPATHICD